MSACCDAADALAFTVVPVVLFCPRSLVALRARFCVFADRFSLSDVRFEKRVSLLHSVTGNR